MATTPAEWLPILTKGLDADLPRLRRLRSYTDGTHALPEMSKKTRKSWIAFQSKSRTLFGLLSCQSLAARISPLGVTVQTGEDDEDWESVAKAIWRRSRMGVILADAILDVLIVGRAYLLSALRDGSPIVTAEKPEQMFAVLDPIDETTVLAAVKVWRDSTAKKDYARVWVPGFRQDFERTATTKTGAKTLRQTTSGGWEASTEVVESDVSVPVSVLVNPNGEGEFENAIANLDRISLGILHRLVTTAYQAAKLRALKGGLPDPGVDADGNALPAPDWGSLLDASPGAMLDLPPGVELWEGQATDVRPLLDAVRDDIREYGAVVGTPLPSLIPDGANQSAEGALAAREVQILRAGDRATRFGPVIEGALLKALRMIDPEFNHVIDVAFGAPHLSSPNERASAAVQAKAAGVPWRTIMRDILGYSPDQVDRMAQERDDEALLAAISETVPQAA